MLLLWYGPHRQHAPHSLGSLEIRRSRCGKTNSDGTKLPMVAEGPKPLHMVETCSSSLYSVSQNRRLCGAIFAAAACPGSNLTHRPPLKEPVRILDKSVKPAALWRKRELPVRGPSMTVQIASRNPAKAISAESLYEAAERIVPEIRKRALKNGTFAAHSTMI